jgi:hypothetical protein
MFSFVNRLSAYAVHDNQLTDADKAWRPVPSRMAYAASRAMQVAGHSP